MRNVIVDIDGTVADCRHRLPHIKGKKKNYKDFYAECTADEPIEDIIKLVELLEEDYDIIFVTGRSEDVRVETDKWLTANLSFKNFQLLMRPSKDYRPDTEVKIELADMYGFTPGNVFLVLEDRDKVVEAWRSASFRCLQVKKGDY